MNQNKLLLIYSLTFLLIGIYSLYLGISSLINGADILFGVIAVLYGSLAIGTAIGVSLSKTWALRLPLVLAVISIALLFVIPLSSIGFYLGLGVNLFVIGFFSRKSVKKYFN